MKEIDPDILDFKSWHKVYYKKYCILVDRRGSKVPKEEKVYFSISSLFHFVTKVTKRAALRHSLILMAWPISQPDQLGNRTGEVPVKKGKNTGPGEIKGVHTT